MKRIHLASNRLSGPVFDMHRLTNLGQLDLENNELSGPVPDLHALVDLYNLTLDGNGFCLQAQARRIRTVPQAPPCRA